MCPEFGATAAIFGVDRKTLNYLKLTGRSSEHISKVEQFTKNNGTYDLLNHSDTAIEYTDVLEVNLNSIVPSIAGSKRPQDRIELSQAKQAYRKEVAHSK
jgi:aconitate hydratase